MKGYVALAFVVKHEEWSIRSHFLLNLPEQILSLRQALLHRSQKMDGQWMPKESGIHQELPNNHYRKHLGHHLR